MASKYSIETVYKLIDQITAPLDKIGIKGKTINTALRNDFIKTQEQVGHFGTTIKKAVAGVALGAFIALGAGIAVCTTQYLDFNSALYGAGAAFSDLDKTAPDFEQNLQKIGKAARDVAAVTEFNAKDTADALSTLARAGVTSVNAVSMLPGVADLATASTVGLSGAVGMAVGGLNTMGLMSDDPKKLAKNMSLLSDVMAYTADSANMSITDVSEAITQGGSFFKTANNNINVFSASLTALANNSIVGAEAGTHLRNIMTNLSAPTASAAAALKKLHITTKDSSGNLLSLTDIVGQFGTSLKGMGDAERNAYLYAIFGKQNLSSINALINTGSDAMNKYAAASENAMGSAAKKAGVMRMSLKNQIEVLKSSLTELGFKFIDAFKTNGSAAITDLTTAINNFNPQPMIDFLVHAVDVIGGVIKILWSMRDVITALVIAWGIYKGAMIAAVIITNVMGMVRAVQALMAAQQGMNIVQAAFNVLMNTNPIGLIITAVGLLILGIIELVKHWKEISAAFVQFGNFCVTVGTAIKDFIVSNFERLANFVQNNTEKVLALIAVFNGPFAAVLGIVNQFKNDWQAITDSFKNGGIIAGIKQIGATILSGLLAPLQGVLEVASHIPGIGGKASEALKAIETYRNGLKDVNGVEAINAAQPEISSSTLSSGNNADNQTISPVTTAQQTAYSRSDNYDHAEISVRAERGSTATIAKQPKSANIRLAAAGSM